jgi:hypothetical protein
MNLDYWIRQAVDCLNEDGSISGSFNIRKSDIAIERIAKDLGVDSDEFMLSEERIRSEIRSFLTEVSTSDDPVQKFYSDKSKLFVTISATLAEVIDSRRSHSLGIKCGLTVS